MANDHTDGEQVSTPLSARRILQTWWPLAASWLLMAVENPILSAAMARLADPEVHLAAFGGVVYPLALIIESPIIMLLAASTALSRDRESYRWLYRFMMSAGAFLTLLHGLIVYTPLYYTVVVGVIGAPAEIIEPARQGLMIMLPWTWSIAYRRFNQGVLIRFGHSRAVGIGTLVRLLADGLVLGIGYLIGTLPGVVIATGAIAAGVVSEALYAGLRVRPVLRHSLDQVPPAGEGLNWGSFWRFYVPLAMTSLLYLVVQPIGSAALSRMPDAVASLAVWSVVSGFVFLFQSLGVAYNEVVIALLDEPDAGQVLRRFTVRLTVLVTALLLVITATPLATLWFGRVSGLSLRLAALARRGLWLALPLPGLAVLQSWYQGTIVHSRRTRGVTQAVIVFLLVSIAILGAGVVSQQIVGLYVGLAAFTMARLGQAMWLWQRSRPAMRALKAGTLRRASPQTADLSAR